MKQPKTKTSTSTETCANCGHEEQYHYQGMIIDNFPEECGCRISENNYCTCKKFKPQSQTNDNLSEDKKEGVMMITESQYPKFKKMILKDYIRKAEVEKVLGEYAKYPNLSKIIKKRLFG